MIFNESSFPFSKQIPSMLSNKPETDPTSSTTIPIISSIPVNSNHMPPPHNTNSELSITEDSNTIIPDQQTDYNETSSLNQQVDPTDTSTNKHHMQTRSKSGIYKPKAYSVSKELGTIQEALQNEHWKSTMRDEYMALLRNNTWTLVNLPPNRRAIGCKWIFKVKENQMARFTGIKPN